MKESQRASNVTLPWYEVVEKMIAVSRMTMLVGQPGTGKSTFAVRAAKERTDEAPEVLQGTPETEMNHLWGFFTLTGGQTSFCDGPLPRALKRERVLLVEEFNLIPLEVRASLLTLRGSAHIDNPFTSEELPISDRFRLIATSNSESLACRRNSKVAQALLDDFLVFEVPDLREDQVRDLLFANFPEAESGRVNRVVELWEEFNSIDGNSEKENNVRLSFRAASHLMKLLDIGVDEGTATLIALVNKYIVDSDVHTTAKLKLSLGGEGEGGENAHVGRS